MRDHAGNLTQLLESDLLSAGIDLSPSFDPSTCSDASAMAGWALRRSLLKKYIPKGETRDAKCNRMDKTLALFLSNNEDCAGVDLLSGTGEIHSVIEEMKDVLDEFFRVDGVSCLSLGSIAASFDVGNGASIGALNTDFYSKLFSCALTSTSEALTVLYRHAISDYPSWAAAERQRQQRYGVRIVSGSRLFYVPKSAEIDRIACTEPNLNMLFQKGIQKVLEKQLRRVFKIDLKLQPDLNRWLAQIGSMTDRYCTIDLSSASDRISCKVVRGLVPPDCLTWLDVSRSQLTLKPNGQMQELHMYSSMGNAFTFPLETAIFAAAVIACYRVLGIKPVYSVGRSLGNFAVFGDDIIVVKEAYALITATLQSIGHRVNYDKSYSEGPFRESCGRDYFLGRNVRGVYIKTLDDTYDFYSAANRLLRWSAEHHCPLPRTISYLLNAASDGTGRISLVPLHEQDGAGLKTPSRLLSTVVRSRHTTRWDDRRGSWRYIANTVKKTDRVSFASEEHFERSVTKLGYSFNRTKGGTDQSDCRDLGTHLFQPRSEEIFLAEYSKRSSEVSFHRIVHSRGLDRRHQFQRRYLPEAVGVCISAYTLAAATGETVERVFSRHSRQAKLISGFLARMGAATRSHGLGRPVQETVPSLRNCGSPSDGSGSLGPSAVRLCAAGPGTKDSISGLGSYTLPVGVSEQDDALDEGDLRKGETDVQCDGPEDPDHRINWYSYNSRGHLLSIVAGRLFDGRIEFRRHLRSVVKSRRYSSCWDYAVGGRRETSCPDSYEVAVELVLGEDQLN